MRLTINRLIILRSSPVIFIEQSFIISVTIQLHPLNMHITDRVWIYLNTMSFWSTFLLSCGAPANDELGTSPFPGDRSRSASAASLKWTERMLPPSDAKETDLQSGSGKRFPCRGGWFLLLFQALSPCFAPSCLKCAGEERGGSSVASDRDHLKRWLRKLDVFWSEPNSRRKQSH